MAYSIVVCVGGRLQVFSLWGEGASGARLRAEGRGSALAPFFVGVLAARVALWCGFPMTGQSWATLAVRCQSAP
jgi:hypothetical protein